MDEMDIRSTPLDRQKMALEAAVNGWLAKRGYEQNAADFEYLFTRQGNFVVAIVASGTLGQIRVGVAKRNKSDKYDPFRGKVLAALRAFENKPLTAPATQQTKS